jgi:hypothetical protein
VAPPQASPRLYVLTTVWGAGATQDTQRLHQEAVVVNTGKDAMAAPAPGGFAVRTADGRQWPLTEAAAYGASQDGAMRPGEQRNIDLFTDVPAGTPSLWLTMAGSGQGTSVRIR